MGRRRCPCKFCAIFEGDPDPAFPATKYTGTYHAPTYMQMALAGNVHTTPWTNPPGVLPATNLPHCCNDFNDVAQLYSAAYGEALTIPIVFASPVLYCPPIASDQVECLLQWWGSGACESDTVPGVFLSTASYRRFFSTFFFRDKETKDIWIGVGLVAWNALPGPTWTDRIGSAFGYLNLGTGLIDPAGGPWVVPITSPAACDPYPFIHVLDGSITDTVGTKTWKQSCWDITPGSVTVTPM